MEKISLCCATRIRPHFMERVWETAKKEADNPDRLEIVFYIDDDDGASIA